MRSKSRQFRVLLLSFLLGDKFLPQKQELLENIGTENDADHLP